MSNIHGLGHTPSTQRLSPLSSPTRPPAPGAPGAAGTPPTGNRDQVEFRGDVRAAMMSKLKASGDVRTDKIADIRAQIDAGTYETPEKIDGAIDKLMDDLG